MITYVIPVVREIPQNMKDELDKYLGRTLLKKQLAISSFCVCKERGQNTIIKI